ncbi:DsbA family protein [Ligilactobacillus apodemi]|uniref:Dithiol-disulfide isomerase n=1 Tax=Ligilactobacillus apodemi DSM 16634 = JCM 16172 TaxID=1423724 RepID=A0A0R1TXK8_9LACO|nr:DsbA family protein [Ligilactobacillus apodemi]KRL83539.1 hypothetical protein FC32_GL000793 [Ligilactobacillus apodemi DSM 16634 = JCM 16172]MCR1900391.1 DsbA family protein [Ligilactobacillus apodemi]
MLEMYLFVNPLGAKCYEAEQNILKLAEESSKKIQIRFIPLLNLQTVSKAMSIMEITGNSLQVRNHVSQILYHAILDYKAALFQGRRRGRDFLMSVQHQLHVEHKKYSEEVVMIAAKKSKLDLEVFQSDRRSELAVNSFRADQKLAAEMNVDTPPSVVIYDIDGFEWAVSFEDCASLATLEELILGNGSKEFVCSKKTFGRQNLAPTVHQLKK